MRPTAKTDLEQLRLPIQALGRRLALQRAAFAAARWGILPLSASLIFAVVFGISPTFARQQGGAAFGLGISALAVCVLRVIGAVRRHPSERTLALQIDRAVGSHDHLTNALCFAARPNFARSPLELAAIEQGLALCRSVALTRLAPFKSPPTRVISLLAVTQLALLLIFVVSPRKRLPGFAQSPAVSASSAQNSRPDSAVDGSVPREALDALLGELASPEVGFADPLLAAQRTKLGVLLRTLRDQNVSPIAALDTIAAMRTTLLAFDSRAHSTYAQSSFRQLGQALSAIAATQKLGAALHAGRLKDAQQAVKALQARLLEPKRALEPAELAALRRAIETELKAVESARNSEQSETAAVAEEQRSLLRKQAAEGFAASDQARKAELERRLHHLDRQRQQDEQSAKTLSDLDRELAKAAEALNGKFADKHSLFSSLEQDLLEAQNAQMSDEQKQRLLEELQALEAILQKSGQTDPLKRAALERFQEQSQGIRGAGNRGFGPGTDGSAERVQPNPAGSTLVVGVGVRETLGPGAASDGTDGHTTGQGKSQGRHHDAQLRGEPAGDLMPSHADVTAVTAANAAGTVSEEVVTTAAARGFAVPSYAQVYRAYLPVQEALLSRPDVPVEKRNQVRRYFHLIQPKATPP